jgi:alkanesulfonate monooxygenase SsuD/methylene tetrahydromethanopterin reductase-like flavin-dependent oxidoreductase (luciferase family)
MEFGIFSNGFRPHTSASQTYEEDLNEIVLADRLGFRDAYISEHHGEPVYINKVDTLPVPELLMCKVAGLTKQIRMGAAVKLIHLAHPVDTAIQAAVTDHVVGGGRFIFGFGSGFPNPLFANERGLSHEDRHPAGRSSPLKNIAVARYVYLADSPREAMEDLRPAITYELGFQIKRGLIRMLKSNYNWQFTGDDVSFDQLAEAGMYFLGDPDSVARQLREFYEASGGFGTLLMVTGKDWATREKRARSMKLFMEHVAPQLRDLEPVREPGEVAA